MIVFVLSLNKYVKGNLAMFDNKELLTIAVIAAALMMVLGTSMPSSVLASTSIAPAEPSDDKENDGSTDNGSGSDGNDDKSSDTKDDNDSNDNGSKDDGKSDGDDDSDGNDSSDSSNDGVPDDYLVEYSTCVSDLSSDDNILTQDDVVDCYGQVFGPNPTHGLGSLDQGIPTSPTTNMPGLENMPFAMQQPEGQQSMEPLVNTQPQDSQQLPAQQQQTYPPVGDQVQPWSQSQPQDGQQPMQSLGNTQPQDGQNLPAQAQQQQPTGLGDQQQQMFPSELPLDAGILDVETIKQIVKERLMK